MKIWFFLWFFRTSSWRPEERMPRALRSRRTPTTSPPSSSSDALASCTHLSSKMRRRPRIWSSTCPHASKSKNSSERTAEQSNISSLNLYCKTSTSLRSVIFEWYGKIKINASFFHDRKNKSFMKFQLFSSHFGFMFLKAQWKT